ncbi:MAG TPA: polysaccharide biosynthesis/export family protein [Vicinamibacterales bacterium]|jgi:polysaccharide export outer membrane protein
MKHFSIVAGFVCAALVAPAIDAQQQQPPPQAAPTTTGAHEASPRATIPDPNLYKLAPGDKLRIEVYKDQQLSQSVQIRPDGKITLPLIGDMEAAGQAPVALRDSIATALKEYVTNPTVTVILVEAAASLAYVVGEVNHPGSVLLQSGPVSVLQALALAGGLKDFADAKNIRILRTTPTGVQTIPFNYKDAIRGGAPFYLKQGDTVVVPD